MMFQNLIESGSHTEELARRSSFFVGTIALYAVLFLVGGVLSIYAYDAHLENQQTEMVLVSFVPPAPPTPSAPANVPRNNPPRSANNNSATSTQPTRRTLMDVTDNPRNVPRDVGTTASGTLPAPSNAVIGREDSNPISGGPVGTADGDGDDKGVRVAVAAHDEVAKEEPPKIKPPLPPIRKVIVSKGPLTGQVINKIVPPYPPLAKTAGVQGAVVVQVLVDETGKVMSAHAVSGHPLLRPNAERAAYQTRFTPTTLADQPVKVSGTITFNFVLN